jgi:hypothetical protein
MRHVQPVVRFVKLAAVPAAVARERDFVEDGVRRFHRGGDALETNHRTTNYRDRFYHGKLPLFKLNLIIQGPSALFYNLGLINLNARRVDHGDLHFRGVNNTLVYPGTDFEKTDDANMVPMGLTSTVPQTK